MISSRMQKRLVKIAERLICKNCGDYQSRGVACKWLKIAESWGAKFTENGFEYMRTVFQNQRRGWRLGLGPFCFGLFKVRLDEDNIFYGYITQIVHIASSVYKKLFDCYREPSYMYNRLERLKQFVHHKLGVYPNDLHLDNYGFEREKIGKILITDWGFDG